MTFAELFARTRTTVSKIILSTLNSTYQHAAFGLRYLLANMKELQQDTEILEFTIAQNPRDIVEKILQKNPEIVGFGVYIWNTQETEEVVSILKRVAPAIKVVLGGPEVTYETEKQTQFAAVDYIVKGEADFQFYELCAKILSGNPPSERILSASLPAITEIKLPYSLFSNSDLQNRILYVEASRGCPYKCEYCLSALDVSVRNFPLPEFLASMQSLIERGARTFKFVDRTFNLNPRISTQILEFFLSHSDKQLFLHFEMVPDRLPDEIKSLIEKFPAGSLQFEIGIQTWNPDVAANVSRRQDYKKVAENFRYLKEKTVVHTHADLIVGLPGETVQSFSEGFDKLIELEPDEIQVGLLKRLKGTPIIRHDARFEMTYSEHPPFQILRNKDLSFIEMQTMARFSKFWDLVANSGQFPSFTKLLRDRAKAQGQSFFWIFMDLVQYLHGRHPQGHGIALLNLTESLWLYLSEGLQVDSELAREIITQDYSILGKRDIPKFLKSQSDIAQDSRKKKAATPTRQLRHLTKTATTEASEIPSPS